MFRNEAYMWGALKIVRSSAIVVFYFKPLKYNDPTSKVEIILSVLFEHRLWDTTFSAISYEMLSIIC